MWSSAEVSAARAVAPERRRTRTPPPSRRWARAAWLLLAMASGAALVLVARILEERGHLISQLSALNTHRDAIEGQRRELALELAATRALLAVKDPPRAATGTAPWGRGAGDHSPVEALVRDVAGKVRGAEVAADATSLRIVLPASALFVGSGAALSVAGGRLLDRLGGVLRKLDRVQIVVGSHTDVAAPRGQFESTWELSAARAVNAVRHLTEESGLDPTRVSAAAHAAELAPPRRPLAQSRRLEIVVTAAP